jgi:hypothetical protein
MFCKYCGAPLNDGSRFCMRCGKEVAIAPPPVQPQAPIPPQTPVSPQAPVMAQTPAAPQPAAPAVIAPPPVKSQKSRYWLFGACGTAVGAILLAAILLIAGVFSAGGGRIEGPGFATPEDAAKAYLEGLKNQDVDAMISAFAVETYAENYDFAALVERIRSYQPTLEMRMPSGNEYTRQLNVQSRRNQVVAGIINQYMCYNAPDELNDYNPTMLEDPDAVANFVDKFKRDTEDYVFEGLKIAEVLDPEDLSDMYMAEANQENIAKQAKTFGVEADDVANVAITFEADGQTWIFCPQTVRYNGKWYLQSLQGNLAILAGMDVFTGGITPYDELGL